MTRTPWSASTLAIAIEPSPPTEISASNPCSLQRPHEIIGAVHFDDLPSGLMSGN